MAKVWLSLIVLMIVQNVLANFCPLDKEISSCDVCIRCGGQWCSQPTDQHCAYSTTDVFCNGESEVLTSHEDKKMDGTQLFPNYVENTLFIGITDTLELVYKSPVERKVTREIYNSTQNLDHINVKVEKVDFNGNQYKVSVEAKVEPGFCTSIGSINEYIYVKIKVDNITEETTIKYHVPCACECSKKIERKSPRCSGNGNFACGVCKCDKDWTGEKCDILACGKKRGDMSCNNPVKGGVECSGNGHCGPCETCICYDDREGYQYFNSDNYCSDICLDTSGCAQCLTNGSDRALGLCISSPQTDPQCEHPMTLLAFNETIAQERDEYNRKVWVRCNDTFHVTQEEYVTIQYFAMKDENSHFKVMVINSFNSDAIVAGPAGTKVPIILGILGLIAIVAVVASLLLWKHFKDSSPMPTSKPDYQNIDPEDCVGVNPLYISPNSTFTNPQFGKC